MIPRHFTSSDASPPSRLVAAKQSISTLALTSLPLSNLMNSAVSGLWDVAMVLQIGEKATERNAISAKRGESQRNHCHCTCTAQQAAFPSGVTGGAAPVTQSQAMTACEQEAEGACVYIHIHTVIDSRQELPAEILTFLRDQLA